MNLPMVNAGKAMLVRWIAVATARSHIFSIPAFSFNVTLVHSVASIVQVHQRSAGFHFAGEWEKMLPDNGRMRFVPIKSDDQLDLQSRHRVRGRWVTDCPSSTGNRRQATLE
jgi:hypothetical protein